MALNGDLGWRVVYRQGGQVCEAVSSDDDGSRSFGRLKRAILRSGGVITSTQRCQYTESEEDTDGWYDVVDEVPGG